MRSLSEFVVELELPDPTLGHLLRNTPGVRIVLLPLSANGAGHPHRFLVCATAESKDVDAVVAAVRPLFADPGEILADGAGRSFTATLPEAALERIRAATGGALASGEVEVLFRPALVMGDRLLLAGIVVRGPFEAMARDAVRLLEASGLGARLVRYGPFSPSTVTPASYDEALTPKQAEILRMAMALGHYEAPRGCTLDDLAVLFGISKAAAADRIRMAERKVIALHFS